MSQHQHNIIAPQKHLGNKPILIDWFALLPTRRPRRLSPHLLDIDQHHIAVSIESLDPGEQLAIIPQTNQDLVVILHRRLKNTQWAVVEFKDLEFSELGFGEFAFWTIC
jgi:hypothetical protein